MGKCAYIISDINGKNPKGNQYMEDFRGHIDQRVKGGYNVLFIRLISVVFFISICVSYYPFQETSLKFAILLSCTGLTLVFLLPFLSTYYSNGNVVFVHCLTALFIISCYIHRNYNPPLTEYADSKFNNLLFSLVFFQLMAPLAFFREQHGLLLAKGLFVFSLVFCIMSFSSAAPGGNIRYSAVGLSPTMMGKIVLIVGAFALTMRTHGSPKNWILYALLVLSIAASVKTGSRGPVIALVFSYGMLLYLKNGVAGIGKSAIYLPIIVVVSFIVLQFMPAEISGRFRLERLSFASHSNAGDRVFLWDLAIAGLKYSLTGYGLGNFSTVTFLAAPHNIFLESAYELGLFITIIYSVIVLYPLTVLKRLAKEGSSFVDFFIVIYIMMLSLSIISGEMTLTSAVMYVASGFIWGFAGERKAVKGGPSGRRSC